MKKNELIQKWLDHNLNEEELAAFKQLDAYSSLQQMDAAAQAYKAPVYNTEHAYEKLKEVMQQPKKKSIPKYWLGIAAILVVSLGVYLSVFNTEIVSHTSIAEATQNISLPDASEVTLLPNSTIEYDKNSWDTSRAISLKGAAYFNVEKGKTFTVESAQGLVTVLGTQFSVKDWGSYFEVTCYEGAVRVVGFGKTEVLHSGMQFISVNRDVTVNNLSKTEWSDENTVFKSVPLKSVLDFVEQNYAVTITNASNATGTFTGSIPHENLTEALQAIAIPFKLHYEINQATVILKSE